MDRECGGRTGRRTRRSETDPTGRRVGQTRRGVLGTIAVGLLSLPFVSSGAGRTQEREPLGNFSGVSNGGYVGFARESREEAMENGTTIPAAADADQAFELDGILYDDGTWEATDPSIPELHTGITTIDAELPDGLSGTFDLEAELMTASGRVVVIGRDGSEIEFDVEVTSADSGELTGNLDVEGETLSVTLVDNEFIVDDTTGSELIDEDLGLPAVEPGENYVEIGFELEPDDQIVTALLNSAGGDSEGDDEDGDSADGGETDEQADDDGAGFGMLSAVAGLGGLSYLLGRWSNRFSSE